MAAKRSVDAQARAPSAAKRSKWAAASSPHGTSARSLAAASEVARRLSAFVKEKMTREQLEAAAAAANAAQAPLILPGGVVDAETAKARALAQASLLALKLPTTQVAPSDLAKRLYIGNLYYDLKEEDIRNWFAPFGAIHSIDLSLEPGASRSKGFCFLEYEDVLAAESAVQVLNGTQLSNRTLRVGRPHRGSSHPGDTNAGIRLGQEAIKNVPTKCIYIANVRPELTSVHLESIFSPFGQVRACVMTAVSPLETKMHRGYGFLEFSEETFAQSAIQHMNGFELAGQPLKVGKASSAAMLINLAISTDKIVRDGEEAALSALQHPKSTTSFDEDDVEAVKDVDADEKRCLCLLNLVKCGEVDKELEEEVRIECSKYGSVRRVLVHELPDHVRIFVEFAAASAAEVARKSLSGRFFGGNQVDARFYSLQELEHQRYKSAFL